LSLPLRIRRTNGAARAERRLAFAGTLVVPALLLLATLQCAPERVTAPTPYVALVTVAPDSAVLWPVGDTVRFSATAQTARHDTIRGVAFTWASGDTSVARVNATGLVTAVGTGRAAITAKAPSGIADAAWVVVPPADPIVVTVDPAAVSLSGVGASASLAAEYRNRQGRVVSGQTFIWTSLNPAVATVSSAGVVTAVAPGQAVIRALADGVSGYALATVAVTDTTAVRIFAPMASGTTATLNGIWGTSATNAYAVGSSGTILHYDGSSWAPMASGTSSDLNAVWGASATDVFAVGSGGVILHWNGLAWAPMASASTASLNDVWGTSPVDVYAVGGRLLHWNGTMWSPADSLSAQPHRAVWGTMRFDIFVGVEWTYFSTAATLLHSDGSQWSPVTSQVSVFGVWGASSFAVFAVGNEWQFQGRDNYTPVPFAMRWDGTASSRSRLSGGTPWRVWGTGPANVYAVGDQGSIYRWNGTTWSDGTARSGASGLSGVWGSSAADVFAVGAGGTILRSVPEGTIAVTPASTAASALGGTVQFTATVRDRAGSPVTGVGFVWTTSDSSVAVTDGVGAVTARRAGTATITATAQGGASASATVTVSAVVAVTPDGASLAGVGSSRTLQAVCGGSSGPCTGTVTWTSLNPAVATVDGAGMVTAVAAGQATISATANGTTAYALVTVSVPEAAAVTRWTRMASDTTRFYAGIWGASAADVYATESYSGGLWHYDGSTWSPVSTGTVGYGLGTYLVSVWGASASDLFVVGYTTGYDWNLNFYSAEQVFRWNGSAWTWSTVSYTGYGPGSFSVWGASPRDVFVSQIFNQRVLVFDGQQWAATPCQGTPQECTGSGMWGTSATNVYAVSNARTILRYDGSAWSAAASGLTQYLSGFWGTSATDIFAVGAGGTILHYDGATWSPMVSGTTQSLNGVWGSSATNVYAVGAGGTILHFDGSSWSPMTSGTSAALYGIWGTTPTTVFVVGSGGTILQGTP